jgi:hypothetical protein
VAGLEQSVLPIRILVVIVELESSVVLMVSAFVVKSLEIISVLTTVITTITSIMCMEFAFITFGNKRELIGRCISKRRSLQWCASLSSYQCPEYLRNIW